MSRSSKTRRSQSRSGAAVNEDEITEALERILPRMEVPTLAFVADELAAHFCVTADEIKEAYRDFLLVQIPEVIQVRRHGTGTSHATNAMNASTPPTAKRKEAESAILKTRSWACTKLTTRQQSNDPVSHTTTPNELPSHGQSGKKRPSPMANAKSTQALPNATAQPSSAPRKKPRVMESPPRQSNQSSERIDETIKAKTGGLDAQQKRLTPHKSPTKTPTAPKVEKTTAPHAEKSKTPAILPVEKRSASDPGKLETPKTRSGTKAVRSSAATPSRRCLDNLKEMAKAAGLLSPQSRLARGMRTRNTDPEKADMLRRALEAACIVFRGPYPTKTEIRECKATRERLKELEGIDVGNMIPTTTRPRSQSTNRKLHFSDPPALKRTDPAYHFVFSDNEGKQDDSDASAPSIASLSD